MANQAPVAWVTGATGGIGTAICRSLADAGYLVVAGYHNPDKAKTWLEYLVLKNIKVLIGNVKWSVPFDYS